MTDVRAANEPQSVDDVLASIRKLVSDEAQARAEEANRNAQPAVKSDPLMLTPDHQIEENNEAGPLILQAATASPTIERPQPAENVASQVSDNETPGESEDFTSMPDTPAPFHDEVALRALISEVIREELQGEMGARITRNVRKLIRREVETIMQGKTAVDG